uniref:Acetyl-coenzyme A carboxylase carboxyl transferase subunit beta, chloroplastic n=1 Tax=Syringa reticulata subsp. pekinensis TaxID=126369 RepID=A0A6M8PG53_9LAMI|nr:acetyl-CoA carboxylase carboxyltransferase beta subunit [Syringa reticulata subsp. pekinensis]
MQTNRGGENSMEKWWFNSMVFKKELERRYGINKSMNNLGPIENTSKREDPNRKAKNIHSWRGRANSSYSDADHLFGIKDIRNLISNDTFLVRDSNGDHYSIYFDIENQIWEIENDHSFWSEIEIYFDWDSYLNNYLNNESPSDYSNYIRFRNVTEYSWNNYINSRIDSYLLSQVYMDTFIVSDSSESEKSGIRTHTESSDTESIDTECTDLTLSERSNNLEGTQRFRHLWVQCEYCEGINYKPLFLSKKYICELCGAHLKMSSSDRIELSIDPGTWDPMDEDLDSLDAIGWDDAEELYKDRIDSYQNETGLTEAVQTGIGQLNGIPVAIGVMDFQFMGGSMGSVVGEKITRLIEYATNKFLPLIIVCASGGARMQEGSLSLMQMAKISSALYDYQSNKKLFYVSILASPTTGGVTASFGMLGDIIIAEPNAYIAFAGKRVIEQTLNITVPEGVQETENLFDKGLFDLIVPRTPLKSVLSELLQLHAFFPLN